ncbi:MAG: response regulator [Myxococcales bacterium]|nr:response regulator [Myxococcales bacterium]
MKNRRTVLIVDRDPNFRRNASRFLKDRGFEVVDVAHPSLGLALLDTESPAFVILDLGMVDPAGIEVLQTMVRSEKRPQVVCVTSDAQVPDVVEAIRRGALDVFERPVDGERLVRLFEETTQRSEQGRPEAVVLDRKLEVDLLVTTSPAMQAVLQAARDRCDEPILLVEGEPGSGQEWVARYAHSIGPRCEGPFVIVPENPSTGSPADNLFGSGEVTSAFAEAKGGLVYIEAICALAAEGQDRLAKLLQGLSAAKVSGAEVRWPPMIGGIDRDLTVEVGAGRLREDIASIFQRSSIRVPPLRQRREDIPELVRRIMQAVQRQVGAAGASVSPQILEELRERDWPGNLPELLRVVSEACVLGDGGLILLDLSARELPSTPEETVEKKPTKSGWRPTLDTSGDVQPYDIYEAEIFRFALENAGGCVSRAAELLGVGRATMYRKMRAYNIDVPPVSERAIARSRGARQRRQEERAAAEARRRAFHEQNAS